MFLNILLFGQQIKRMVFRFHGVLNYYRWFLDEHYVTIVRLAFHIYDMETIFMTQEGEKDIKIRNTNVRDANNFFFSKEKGVILLI